MGSSNVRRSFAGAEKFDEGPAPDTSSPWASCGSGTYKTLICVDVDSQFRRFAEASNCSLGGKVALSTSASARQSGPTPSTTLKPLQRSAGAPATAVLRFGSTISRSTFQCSLDGGPWLACRSPWTYRSLVDGSHTVSVRAIGPAGKADLTPARTLWTVAAAHAAVTTTSPVVNSTGNGSGTAAAVSDSTSASKLSSDGTSGTNASGAGTNASGAGTNASGAGTNGSGDGTNGSGGGTTPSNPNPPVKYSVGGMVSGLSGSVVLQDNGGDDLTVGSDGSFTFTTPLADGPTTRCR